MTKREAERTTCYRDGEGRKIEATTCDRCNGRGCEFCLLLGFTKTVNGQPVLQ